MACICLHNMQRRCVVSHTHSHTPRAMICRRRRLAVVSWRQKTQTYLTFPAAEMDHTDNAPLCRGEGTRGSFKHKRFHFHFNSKSSEHFQPVNSLHLKKNPFHYQNLWLNFFALRVYSSCSLSALSLYYLFISLLATRMRMGARWAVLAVFYIRIKIHPC